MDQGGARASGGGDQWPAKTLLRRKRGKVSNWSGSRNQARPCPKRLRPRFNFITDISAPAHRCRNREIVTIFGCEGGQGGGLVIARATSAPTSGRFAFWRDLHFAPV